MIVNLEVQQTRIYSAFKRITGLGIKCKLNIHQHGYGPPTATEMAMIIDIRWDWFLDDGTYSFEFWRYL